MTREGAGILCAQVTALCAEILADARAPGVRQGVEDVVANLAEPVRVAVAGRVSAGKSTLVNAILGRRIAPTGSAETTRVVTVFRYGYPERVEVQPLTGPARSVALNRDGSLPERLGIDPRDIDHVRIWLSDSILQRLTLIDTPGLSSANAQTSARTAEFLALEKISQRAASGADALVFVLNHAPRRDELETMSAFRSLSGGTRASAATALAVLSKADRLDPDAADPWLAAKQAARRHEDALRGVVAGVVPVIGLLGETAASGDLTEQDAQLIDRLAALAPSELAAMLISGDRFVRAAAPGDPAARERLLERLDLFGVGRAVGLAREGRRGAAALSRELLDMSGLMVVRGVIEDVFARHADALKAGAALAALDRLLHAPDGEGSAAEMVALRDHLERTRLRPEMYRLGLLSVLEGVAGGEVAIAPGEVEELRRMASETTVWRRLGLGEDSTRAERAQAAMDAARRWKLRENDLRSSTAEETAASLARRSYEHLWADLESGGVEAA